MSWDPCPECGRPTEKFGQSCNRCCDRHRDTTEIVDTICRHGESKADNPSDLAADDLVMIREKLRK